MALVEYCALDAEGRTRIHVIEGNNPSSVARAEYSLYDSHILGYGTVRDIVMVTGFRGGRGINAILLRGILIGRSGPPDASVDRNADIGQSRLYLFHPLTPLAMEAFRPR